MQEPQTPVPVQDSGWKTYTSQEVRNGINEVIPFNKTFVWPPKKVFLKFHLIVTAENGALDGEYFIEEIGTQSFRFRLVNAKRTGTVTFEWLTLGFADTTA